MLDKHVCNLCDWLNSQLRRLFKPLLPPPREDDRPLDISACTVEQKKEILKHASEGKTLRDRTFLAEVKFLLAIYCSRICGVCGIAKFAPAFILADCTVWDNYKPLMNIAK
jgi:hypothetical protein